MLPIAVLAGGFATRLGHLTKEFPKCLIEIHGKPFVDWQLDLLKKSGYQNFVFCLSYKSDQVQEYLGDGSRFGISIEYSLDGNRQLGTGGAIRKAIPILGSEFAVLYGDSYLPIKYAKVESAFLKSSTLGLMTVFKNEGLLDVSNVMFENNRLLKYQKDFPTPQMHHIDYGLSYFRSEAFKDIRLNQSFDLADLCSDLSAQKKFNGYEVFNRFYEIGSHKGIQDFTEYIERNLYEL